jgi:hypothetical protein
LAQISKLDNIDKHRQLAVVASTVRIHIKAPKGVAPPMKDLHFDHWGLGGHVVTFTFSSRLPLLDIGFAPTFSAAL